VSLGNAHAPPTLGHIVIDLTRGPVHISSRPNSNPNSMCLTLISEILSKGGKVIWMARELPDAEKMSDFLGHLSEAKISRMMVIEFGEDFERKGALIEKTLLNLSSKDLLVVEEWCENHGRAKKKDGLLLQHLASLNKEMKIVITSNPYEDASGKKRGFDGWIVRGEKVLGRKYRTVWMTKIEGKFQKVIITDGGTQYALSLTKRGFERGE